MPWSLEYRRKYSMEWFARNKDKRKLYQDKYYQKNKKKICEKNKYNLGLKLKKAEYKRKNRELLNWKEVERNRKNPSLKKARQDRWIQRNPGERRNQSLAWAKRNRDKCNSATARRRAICLHARPSWANDFFIAEAYDLAKRRTHLLGFKWNVDHIVPLRSHKVCGLHCEANLQVISDFLNKKKSNKKWPNMPEEMPVKR